jgi:hypothetical protein
MADEAERVAAEAALAERQKALAALSCVEFRICPSLTVRVISEMAYDPRPLEYDRVRAHILTQRSSSALRAVLNLHLSYLRQIQRRTLAGAPALSRVPNHT